MRLTFQRDTKNIFHFIFRIYDFIKIPDVLYCCSCEHNADEFNLILIKLSQSLIRVYASTLKGIYNQKMQFSPRK